MSRKSLRRSAPLLALLLAPLPALAAAGDGGGTWLDLRYRHERVDQSGFERDAVADTLRVRVGARSAAWHGWSALVEADAVLALDGSRHNDTRNGRRGYPVVADPAGAGINQALLRHATATTTATLGRQRINLDNQRFVGGSAWRQNEQTFDGVYLQLAASPRLALDYAWIGGFDTVFGPSDSPASTRANPSDSGGDSHLLRAALELAPQAKLVAYHYRVELDDMAVTATAPLGTLDSRTSGLRLEGRRGPWSYAAEYARQRELAGNPWRLDSRYALAELGYAFDGGLVLKAGLESLGGGQGEGNRAFQTPLATRHAFQGWADVFLTTPAQGVDDRYAGVAAPLAGGSLQAWYHDFVPERGGGRYGRELDLSWAHPVPGVKGLAGLLKLACYRSDDAARTVDTAKVWLQLQYSY